MLLVSFVLLSGEQRDRFWAKVSPQSNGCWVWRGSMFPNGYGYFQLRWKPRKTGLAHRVAYFNLRGMIPPGLDLDHLCRNRACVNPNHLEPVTRSENLRRSPGLMGRVNRERTHCKRGHPFDETNTYRYRGERLCRTCRRDQMRRQRLRQQKEMAS